MRLFASPAFSGAALVMALTLFAQVGLVFALSEYFGLVRHASTLDIGVRLIALNGFTVVLGPLVGRLMNRTSPGLLLVIGLVVGGTGALCVTLFHAGTGTGEAALLIGVLGIGIALAMAPITTIAMDSFPHRLASTAGAANSALRQIGSALGPAVFGVVLTHRTLGRPARTPRPVRSLPGRPGPGERHGLPRGHPGGAFLHLNTPRATGRALSAYGASFTDALHTCALTGSVGMLVAALIALVTIGVRARPAHGAGAPAGLTHPAGAVAGDMG
ncbi:MFS transporter [Streptomyces sp. ECR2.10]|uniref:MFS transporter n=1 Tax=Streptomyces sp. ECR2.10 TaxID=3461012 RepID=UPI004041153E